MGGFFGVAGKTDCVRDLFYGTDYHSHLGTSRGGMAVLGEDGFKRYIHDITNSQFRSKFSDDLPNLRGNMGIGVISDYEDQPLIIRSHLGVYAIVTVGKIDNLEELARTSFRARTAHFSEMSLQSGEVNQTELVATLINREEDFVSGLSRVQESVRGSCSVLLLTCEGLYVARDRLGRTPVVLGRKEDGTSGVSFESNAFPNLGYEVERELGPAEIVLVTPDGIEQKKAPGERLQICTFLWVYYGYPASTYEGVNAEIARYNCGAALARRDAGDVTPDVVAGIPDSGTGHALGYANESGVPYRRPYVKYTPTWPRSFMPQDQRVRQLVANMKLIPIREIVEGNSILFCDDSIVRGTQLRDNTRRMFDCGAKEVHIRIACPPLLFGCKFLNFSRSRSILDLAGRRAIEKLEGDHGKDLEEYSAAGTCKHCAMVDTIREDLGVTSLKYQTLQDLVQAVGMPKEKLCTYCWDGAE